MRGTCRRRQRWLQQRRQCGNVATAPPRGNAGRCREGEIGVPVGEQADSGNSDEAIG